MVAVGKNDPVLQARIIEQTLPHLTFQAALTACPPDGVIVSLAGVPERNPELLAAWPKSGPKLVVPLAFRPGPDYLAWFRNGRLAMAILPKPDAPFDPNILEWPVQTWFERCRVVVDAEGAERYAW